MKEIQYAILVHVTAGEIVLCLFCASAYAQVVGLLRRPVLVIDLVYIPRTIIVHTSAWAVVKVTTFDHLPAETFTIAILLNPLAAFFDRCRVIVISYLSCLRQRCCSQCVYLVPRILHVQICPCVFRYICWS